VAAYRSWVPVPAATALVVALAAAAGPARADRAMARALVEEGERQSAAGRGSVALERYEQAMAEDPDYLPAYEVATALWLAAGRFNDAIVHLGQVSLRHPSYPFAWYALAFAYRRTGRPELAVECYEAYLGMRPDEPDPYYGLAMAELELDHGTAATAALERYLALENRAERSDFVAQARLELARLRGGSGGAGPVDLALDELRAFGRWARALSR
jgi:tetratricopeptide (TPR) repeat protein